MMPIIREVIRESMLAVTGSLAASVVAKVTVTAALGLVAIWLARANRAAVRHALLASAFAVMLLLPIASMVAPRVHISLQVVENRLPALPQPLLQGGRPTPSAPAANDPGDRAVSVQPASKISWSSVLLGGWIAGGLIVLLPLIIGLWQIRLLRRAGLPWPHGQSLAQSIALDAGMRRRVAVLLHEAAPGPMACGTLHPTIVLPKDAENWDHQDLTRALVHELEHIRRGDSVTRCLARAACAAYWFHPLVWAAWRRLVLESERACDDAVLRSSEATAYADQLVGLAKRLSGAHTSPLLAMANRADLAARVGALLDARQRRGRAGMLARVLACAAAVVLIIAMSPLTLVAAPLPDARPVDPPRLVAQVQTPQAQPVQAQPAPAPRTPAAAPSRLLAMFFDLNSLDAEALARAREQATRFVQEQATPADRISVMAYSSKVNVLTDFTNNQDAILAALRMIVPADAGNNGAGNPAAGPEFDIFTADRQLAALQDAIRLLEALPEKKALIYFADGIARDGADNQAQLRATTNAAIRANVSIWPVDARGLVATPPR